MKIKRSSAASMRAALALVRAEQGPEAVILSRRRGADGIEVIAAVDYDEALFVEANRQRVAAANPEPPTPAPAASPEPIAAPSRAPATQNQSPARTQSRMQTPAQTQTQAQAQAQAPAQTPARTQAPASAARPPVPKPSPQLIPASFRKLTLSSLPAIAPELFAAPQPARTPAATRPAAPPRAPATASAKTAAVAAMPTQPPRPNPGLGAMQRELQDLRQMLETGLAGITSNHT